MARCVEDVTRRWSGGGGSYRTSCTNPGEFAVRTSAYAERTIAVCRTHLPVLVKRLLLDPKRAKLAPLQVTLVIHEEEEAAR